MCGLSSPGGRRALLRRYEGGPLSAGRGRLHAGAGSLPGGCARCEAPSRDRWGPPGQRLRAPARRPLAPRHPRGPADPRPPAAPPAASVRNVPPQHDARRRPGCAAAGARGGGGVRAEVGVCGKEKGKGDAAGCGAAPLGDRRQGAASSPALSAEDGSDESSQGGHFLLGWMRRSRRRRGGDRTERGPCRGEQEGENESRL